MESRWSQGGVKVVSDGVRWSQVVSGGVKVESGQVQSSPVESSRVQSSRVQSSPVQSSPVVSSPEVNLESMLACGLNWINEASIG